MVIQQAFNGRTKAWVKFDFTAKTGFRALDVKQKNPTVPFKGVPIAPSSKKFVKKKK